MANDTTQVEKSATFLYKLTLTDMILSKEKSPAELKLEQGIPVTCKDTDNDVTYNVTLHGIKVNKKIYQPTQIEAELFFMINTDNGQSTEKTSAPSFEAVSGLLLQRQAKLEVTHVNRQAGTTTTIDEGNSYLVAENCYVYELDPQLKRDAKGTKMYVKLNIFSMDKLMTLNKYSKAYVARKLGSGILKPESLNFGTVNNSEDPLVKTNIKNLRFLKYNDTLSYVGQDKKQMNAIIPSEFIQPYLVQYNESFYDFLVRTSNRCGEFLYFEDGALTLGLPDSGEPILIDDFEAVTKQNYSADPLTIEAHTRDSMKDGVGKVDDLNQSAIEKESTGFPKDAFAENTVSNAEQATDEYFFPLYRGKFTNQAREIYFDGSPIENIMSRAFPLIDTILGNETAGIAGAGAVIGKEIFVTEGLLQATAASQVVSVNNDSRKTYLKPYRGKTEQHNRDKTVQFSSLKEEGWTTIDYYNDIHKHEAEQQRKIVCIDMGTAYVDVKLGQKIKVDGLTGNYVVIQVQQVSEEAWNNNYDKYNSQSSDLSADQRRSQKIYAIPSYVDDNDNNKEKFIPPVHPVPVIRKAGPQTAFVTANFDPKYQGRVRVAYPWQSLNSELNAELAEAERKLEVVTQEKELVEKEATTLPLLAAELRDEVDQLNAYVKASEEERKNMLAELEKQRKTLENDILQLKADRQEKDPALAKLEAQIESMKNDPDIEESELEQKQVELEVFRRDVMADEIKTIDESIAAKQQEIEKIDRLEQEMKDAAKEYDKNKESAIIEKKQAKLDWLTSESESNEEKLKAMEKQVEEAKEQVKKAKEKVEKEAVDMSTPWIRVASPMATPGGGAFFRPRVGDEVLINFDSDNVERPYVVGSLYSKNTLTPDEGLYRKAAPVLQWKNLSMQLMSPNGHHITFTDPPGGNCFITNVISPGMGYYATILPGISTLNAMGEEYKDLAGGIHIGDRYGMYEIEMKSHKRSIDINSPFGTVSINAFSGITISAPNGNVTIKGKNITLEAGNKITMLSGQNIEDPDIGDPEGWGDYLGKKGVSIINSILESVSPDYIESIVDFSLIRHVVEVFARPVDGTLLLKSKRFLKLEAGPGHATIQRDRYNASEKRGKSEEFYKFMLEYINQITQFVDAFFREYEILWKTGNSLMTAYQETRGYKCLIKGKEPDILAIVKGLTQWNEDLITHDNTFKDGGKELYDPNKFNDREDKYDIKIATLAAAKKYAESIVAIQAQVASFNKLFDGVEDNYVEATSLKNLLKPTIDTVFPNVFNDWKKDIDVKEKLFKQKDPDDEDFFSMKNKTVVKRKLILAFLYKVSNAPFNAQDKYIKVKYDINYIKDTHVLNQEYYWKRQIQIMDHYWQKHKLWRSLWENTIGAFTDKFLDNFRSLDLNVWSDKGEGEILFSDREDSTLNFDGAGLHEEKDANIGTIDHLKEYLMGIK